MVPQDMNEGHGQNNKQEEPSLLVPKLATGAWLTLGALLAIGIHFDAADGQHDFGIQEIAGALGWFASIYPLSRLWVRDFLKGSVRQYGE